MSIISGEAYWAHVITPNTKFNPDGEWSIEGGPVLDQDSQDALNDAFNTFVNEDGLTIKQVIDNTEED